MQYRLEGASIGFLEVVNNMQVSGLFSGFIEFFNTITGLRILCVFVRSSFV